MQIVKGIAKDVRQGDFYIGILVRYITFTVDGQPIRLLNQKSVIKENDQVVLAGEWEKNTTLPFFSYGRTDENTICGYEEGMLVFNVYAYFNVTERTLPPDPLFGLTATIVGVLFCLFAGLFAGLSLSAINELSIGYAVMAFVAGAFLWGTLYLFHKIFQGRRAHLLLKDSLRTL